MRLAVEYQASKNAKFKIDLKDLTQAFEFLSYADSVFGVKQCGNCDSTNVRFSHRQPQGYDYYSVVCQDCGHELKFGQQKDSKRLFPKGWEPPYNEDDKPDRKANESNEDESGGDDIPF